MKIYKAKKNSFFLYLIAILFVLPFIGYYIYESDIFLMLPLAIPLLITLWIYFDTGYKIQGTSLFYRSGIIRGKIDINKINQITVGKTMWSGLKPALAKNGLIIKYGYDEIYIAPENNREVVADLLNIKPDIILKE